MLLRIEGVADKTPVMTSRTVNEAFGAEVYFKCENFQRMGAFKFRGAYNAMSQLTEQQKKSGVLTYSSGNHAQGVARAAAEFGLPAVIIMPADAPRSKIDGCSRWCSVRSHRCSRN